MLSFLFNQLPGSATDQEHPKLHGNRNSADSEAVHPREKNKGACSPFFRQHRSAGLSTVMMLAFRTTWSPAGATTAAPGAEVLTETKLLEGVLIIQVSAAESACRFQDFTGSIGVLSCIRCPLLKLLSYQVKLPRLHNVGESELEEVYKILMKKVIQKLNMSSVWWLETRSFHQKKESSFYFCARGTEGHLLKVNKNNRPCNKIIEKL